MEIFNNEKPDKRSIRHLLWAWKIQLKGHLDSFGTSAVVKLTKTLNSSHPYLRAEIGSGSGSLHLFVEMQDALIMLQLALIMNLYRRKKPLDGTTKNEKSLAKELLQELLDMLPKVVMGYRSRDPPQHVITECNFTDQGSGEILAHTQYDVELMKLLLDCRIHVNDVNSMGDTILHHAAGLLRSQLIDGVCKCTADIIECLTLLLQNGVCPNARNHYNNLARHTLNNLPSTLPSSAVVFAGRVSQILKNWEYQQAMTLEYMAAVAVIRSKIPYKRLLPTVIVKFVEMLGPRPKQCWEEEEDDDDNSVLPSFFF